jgi:hypothetical protein
MSYYIAQPTGCKRPLLLQVRQRNNGKLVGVVPDHTQYGGERRTFEFTSKEVIVPLGDEPPYGNAYGVLVEPCAERWHVKGYGDVFCYVAGMAPVVRDRIQKSLVLAVRKIQAITPGLDVGDMITELRNIKGKQAGHYSYRPKATDVLVIRPMEGQGIRELVKVETHELAHRYWFRNMTPENRAVWIKLYARFVHVESVSVDDIKRMASEIKQMESIRDWLKEAEPEEQAACAIYLGWLAKVRGVTSSDVRDLVAAGSSLPIPDTHLHRSDTVPPLTLYSKGSATELYAEAVSSACIGALEDKRITALLGIGQE